MSNDLLLPILPPHLSQNGADKTIVGQASEARAENTFLLNATFYFGGTVVAFYGLN